MTWFDWWTRKQDGTDGDTESSAKQIQDASRDVVNATAHAIHNAADHPSTATTSVMTAFSAPSTIAATALLTTLCLGCFKFYRVNLRRFPEATNIHQSYFRKRSILGRCTSVGDGDNFRIFHTPGGRVAGWGWIPWRKIPSDKKLLKNKTIHIRLAGIDAPELAHFGRPAQPYSKEALEWLTSYVLGRRVRAQVYKIDQYNRVVATAYVWKGILKRDIGLQMLRAGFATVYEAKSGAEFGKDLEPKYRGAEAVAKKKKKGMWAGDVMDYESPMDYKRRYKEGSSAQP